MKRLGFALLLLALAAWAAAPSHGPKRGYLIISGGADYHTDIPRLIQMAGGADARIVVIPTASVNHPETAEQLQH
ncbi:MAG: hypothetical protein ACRD2D_05020, partial [Terriglobales bacterium]